MVSRATVGRAAGLDWVQTCVLKAVCDEAMDRWDRRLTLDQVGGRLVVATRISRQQIEAALGPLCDRGYLTADDAPGNPEIVVHVTSRGLEEYCHRFVPGYGRITREVLTLVCQDVSLDVVALSHRSGQPEMLVEHVLTVAEAHGLLRLTRQGHYVVVRETMPHLRRWVSGAA